MTSAGWAVNNNNWSRRNGKNKIAGEGGGMKEVEEEEYNEESWRKRRMTREGQGWRNEI